MSDIYLSLTETPTVVTLSQPVVSGALSSTVTVSNVVSVSVVTMPAITVQAAAPAVTTVAGSVAVSNFPASQVVSVSNFPATQTIAGTVTANDSGALSIVNSSTVTKADVKFTALAGAYNPTEPAQNYIIAPINVDLKGITFVDGQYVNYRGTCVTYNPSSAETAWKAKLVESSVTVGNSVTIGSLPAISGTVTANVANVVTINTNGSSYSQRVVSKSQLQFSVVAGAYDALNYASDYTVFPLKITPESQGRNLAVDLRTQQQVGGISDLSAIAADAGQNPTAAFVRTQVVGGSVTIGNTVTVSQAGSVTIGAVPNGTLITRFGTPTTANTAFATSAVTNTSRKYLLIQNVTTGSNVITVGIGFTPTTTQGIQLTAGAGITFESSYIPTGAVQILSSVTASNFTILEA